MVFGVGPGNGFRVREAQMANDQIQLMLRVLSREQRLPPHTQKTTRNNLQQLTTYIYMSFSASK
jgi:hypothetical protein